MLVFVCCCVFLLDVCSAFPTFKYDFIETDQNEARRESAVQSASERDLYSLTDWPNKATTEIGISNNKRKKRTASLILKGALALRFLLKGTQPIKSYSRRYRKYEKPGNLNTALKDFYSVDPQHVTQYKNGRGVDIWAGRVGDKAIQIRNPGYKGKPVLEISDPRQIKILQTGSSQTSGQYADRIVYINP